MKRFISFAPIFIAIALVTQPMLAADKFFSYAAGTNVWNTTSNFWGISSGGPYNAAWSSNDAAFFEGTGGTVTLAAGQTANGLTFTVAGYSLSSSTLTLNAPAVISNDVQATIGSILAGTAPVTKSGTGTLTLSGANTYTGGTIVNNGVLSLAYNSGFNGTIKNDLLIKSTGEVQQNVAGWSLGYDGGANYVTNLIINGGTLNFILGGGGIPASSIDMTGGVIKSSLANIDWYRTANAQATFTTHSNATADLVSCGLNLRLGTTGFAVFNIEDGAASDDLLIVGPLLNGAGTQPITKSGSGQMTLMGTNTYSGTTTIAGGTLTIGGAGQLGSGNYSAAITDNANLTYASSAPQTFGGVISGTGSLTQSGPGSLTLSGSSSYTGVTTVNGGTLTLAATGSQYAGTIKGDLVINNATVRMTAINGLWGWDPTVMKTITLNPGAVLMGVASNVVTVGNITLNGGTLTAADNGDATFGSWAFKAPFGNTVTVTVPGSSTIDAPRSSLNGSGTSPVTVFDVNSGVTLLVPGVLLNGGGMVAALAKAGSGTLVLSATNAYTGTTTINGGKLVVDGSLAAASVVTANFGGWLGGTGSVSGRVIANAGGGIAPGDGLGVTILSNVTLSAGSVNVFDFDGTPTNDLLVVARSGGLTNNGTSFLLYSNGTSTAWVPALGMPYNLIQYSGTIAGTGGYSVANPIPGLSYTFTTNGGYVSVTFGGASVWNGGGSDNNWKTALNWGGVAVTNGAALVFDGSIRPVTTNDFIAGTAFSILFTNTAGGFILSGNQVSLAGDVVNLSPNNQTLNTPLILPLIRTFDTGAGGLTVNGILSGAGGVAKTGAGNLTLTAANPFTGLTAIFGGTLLLANGSALQGSTLDYGSYGGTLSFGTLTNVTFGGLMGSQDLALTNDSAAGVTLSVGNNNGTANYGGALSGGGSIVKIGTGALTLSGTAPNKYTGPTTINQGVLYLNKTANVAAIPGVLVMAGGNQPEVICQQINQFAAGATVDTTGASNWERLALMGKDQTLSNVTDPTGKLIIQNGSYVAGVGPANAVLTVNSTTNGNIGGVIRNNDNGSGAVTIGLVKSGAGTLTLSGANINYSGSTIVNEGRLVFSIAGDNSTANIYINAGAVMEVNPTSGPRSFYNVNYAGGGTLLKTGANLWAMDYDNASTGDNTTSFGSGALIDIQGGTIRLDYGGGNWTANKANLNIASGATFDMWDNTTGIFVDALTGSGTVIKAAAYNGGNGTLTVGVANGSGTFSGVLKNGTGTTPGILSLTKTGSGTQTLTGTNNTYTGATTINGGLLAVNGSLGTGTVVTAISGGTLGGTGNVAGLVTPASGGHVAPGIGGIGILTNGSLTLSAGTLDIEFDLSNPQTNDQVIVSGNNGLTINGGAINVYSNGTSIAWATPGTYNLIQYSGAIGGGGAAALLVANPALNTSYTFSTTGGWVTMTVATTTGVTWSGASTVDSKWQTATNWTGNVAPNPNDILTFSGSTRLATTNDFTAGTAFGGIVFNAGAGAFVLAGQSVTLAGTVFNYSTTAQALALPVAVGAGGVTLATQAGNLSVSGIISGSDPLTKSGSYTLTLTGTNSVNGGLTVAAGTLELGGAGQLGSGSFSGAVTNNGALLVNSTANQTLSGVISGLGGLTKSASGTLTLSGTNTYAGTTTLSAGRLVLAGGDNRLPTGTTVSITGASTFDVGLGGQTIANLTLGATGTLMGGGALSVNGPALSWTGLMLDTSRLNNFSYTNAVGSVSTINQVTWKFATNSVLTAASMYIGSSGGYADQSSTIQFGQAGTINIGTVGVLNNASVGTINLTFIPGLVAPSLVIRGTAGGSSRADWLLANVNNGNNAYGNVTMDLAAGVTGSTLDARFGTLTIGTQGWSPAQNRVSNGALSFGAGTLDATTIIVGRAYSTGGGGGGRGTLNINGGTVIVGTLTLAQAESGNASQGTVNLNNGGTVTAQTIQAGVNYSAVRAINWNDGTIKNPGAGTNLTVSGLTAFTLAATGIHAIDISGGCTGNVNSAISGAGGLIKVGAGVVNLMAPNTFSGATTVSNGILRLGIPVSALSTNGSVVMAGGTLDARSYTNFVGALTVAAGSSTLWMPTNTIATLQFKDSSATNNVWDGTLNLIGTLYPQAVRIGTSHAALRPDQITRMNANGRAVSLDPNGYVVLATGTLIIVQ